MYGNFCKHNDGKNLFSAARTPAVLFTVMVVFYIGAAVMGLVGLESIANLCNLLMFVFLILLLTWFYIRYSGQHRQLAIHIDQLADILWDNVSGAPVAFFFNNFFILVLVLSAMV